MIKILITGANSFVGSNFKKYSGFQNIKEISLFDYSPEAIDFGKADVVLHLAAIVHKSKRIKEDQYFEVNRDLCLRVARNAKKAGIKQFVFLSTIKVYGDIFPAGIILNENSECHPEDAYGRSKMEAEIGLRALETPSFKVSIVRTPLIYGEGMKGNMLSLVKLIRFFPILPFGNNINKQSFTYSENLVGFIDRIVEKGCSGTFIAKDEGSVSTTELVSILAKNLGKKVQLFYLPAFLLKLLAIVFPEYYEKLYRSLEFNNEMTLNKLEFKPLVSTEEGLNRTVRSYLES